MFISAEQLFPATTNGCAANATVEVTAQYPEVRGLAFDGTSKEYAQFVVALPKRWDASTVTAQVYWTSAATDADSVVWGVQAQSYADGDLVGSATNAWGAAKEVTDAMGSAAYKMYRTSETGEITIAGSPADNEFQFFQVYRDPTNPSDTATEDAILMGVKLRWDSDALNDD